MKTAKKPQPKQKWTAKKVIATALFSVVFLALSYLIFYLLIQRPLEIRQNRQDFARAEAVVAETALKIEDKLGVPAEKKESRSCNYSSFGFEKGIRSCGISLVLIYTPEDLNKVNDLLLLASSVTPAPLSHRSGIDNGLGTFDSMSSTTNPQKFSQELSLNGEIACEIEYSYPLKDSVSKGISVSCGGPAKGEYYPVVD